MTSSKCSQPPPSTRPGDLAVTNPPSLLSLLYRYTCESSHGSYILGAMIPTYRAASNQFGQSPAHVGLEKCSRLTQI